MARQWTSANTRRLTDDDLGRVDAGWRKGTPAKVLARELGCSPGTIWGQYYRLRRQRDKERQRYWPGDSLAQSQLREEIAAAKREWATSPPYKPETRT